MARKVADAPDDAPSTSIAPMGAFRAFITASDDIADRHYTTLGMNA